MNPWKIIGWIVLGCMVLMLGFCGLFAYNLSKVSDPEYKARVEAAKAASERRVAEAARADPNVCTVEKIDVVSVEAGFVDECRRTPCPSFKGAGVLNNRCTIPVGVQLKITGLDSSGKTIAVRDLWPNSIRNIPPGEYSFSMDQWLDHDPRMKTFEVEVIETKVWR